LQEHYQDFSQFNAVWRTAARSWEEFGRLGHVEAPYFRKPPGGSNDALETEANLADPARTAFFADCDAFVAVVADQYFELSVAAIKAADPNHLVIGSRFGYQPHSGVIAAAGRYLDVISFNCYDFDATIIIDAYALTGKPCLISGFPFAVTIPACPIQAAADRGGEPDQRARCFERYVSAALRKPAVVGYHWFEHADQPAETF
jgi:agarase